MTQTGPDSASFWRKCSACKKPIGFSRPYYACSVSTCNGLRTGYVFCGVPCWETHLPGARHRNAAAVEMTSPTAAEAERAQKAEAAAGGAETTAGPVASPVGTGAAALAQRPGDRSLGGVAVAGGAGRPPQRVLASSQAAGGARFGGAPSSFGAASGAVPREVLVIASRLKEFIDARSGGFNTSQSVLEPLSDHLRVVCDQAIENARIDGRKTVLDRDLDFLKRFSRGGLA